MTLRSPALLSHRLRMLAAVPLAALALTLLAPAARAVPPGGPEDRSNGASVSISPLRVKQGGRIKVSGRNWKAKGSRVQSGAQVTIKLDDLDIVAVFKIKNKKFSGYVRIPRAVKPGRHWLRFLAAEPATSIKSKRFSVVAR